MEAVAWTAISLLAAALVGSFFYLGPRFDNLAQRIDAQGSALGSRIEALGARLDARIDAQGADLGSRIDALSGRIDALSARIDLHFERHAG